MGENGGTRLLSERYTDALGYAAEAHARQQRKSTASEDMPDEPGIPYVSHLLDVSARVLADGGTEDEAIAGLLHDVVEDQGGMDRLEDVRTRFGGQVAAIVLACSDATDPEVKATQQWRERKQRHLDAMATDPTPVLRVLAADKLSNATAILSDHRDIGNEVFRRFRPYQDAIAGTVPADDPDAALATTDPVRFSATCTLWYYTSAVVVLTEGLPGRLSSDLAATVHELVERVGAA